LLKIIVEKLGKKDVLPFACFWLVCIGVIVGRCFYDLKVYFYGDTLVYRFVSQSGYDYLLHLPVGYTDFGRARPLMIFLHGAGETGKDVEVLKRVDPVRYAKGKVPVEDFPFIVISPMTPQHGWQPRRVVQLLDGNYSVAQIGHPLKGLRFVFTSRRLKSAVIHGQRLKAFTQFDPFCVHFADKRR
jgi:hypothetical protein